ncbi:MAG: hypothetical protein IJO62_04485 [Clostridia bacterium]|nr:hypothetical protein [Clostridia bacterium]
MRKFKVLSLILAVALILSVIPVFTASAEESVINDESDLIAAAQNGGVYTISNHIPIFQTIEVKKDLTLNFKTDAENGVYQAELQFLQYNPTEPKFNVGFLISGATLTLNGEVAGMSNTGISYSYNAFSGETGVGSLFKLVGVSYKDTKLVINDGQFNSGGGDGAWNLFEAETPSGAKKPQIVANSRLSSGKPENFLKGDCDFTITGGTTTADPSAYVSENYYVIDYTEYMGQYEIVELSAEYSDEFKNNLDANGDFIIKRYHPSLDTDPDALFMDLDAMYYEEGPDFYNYYGFIDYNVEDDTALVCYQKIDYMIGDITSEYHLEKLNFVYDPEVKKDADKMIAALPKGDNPDEGEFHWYKASDLELVNYWLSGGTDATQFVNFSGEFKKAFNYKNYTFKLDSRMGGGAPFDTSVGGIGMFMQNGTVYGSGQMGVEAKHILYVPSNTANTTAAKKEAVQKKLDDFIGEGKVTVKETTVWESIMYMFWLWDKDWILEEIPTATFEKFYNGELEGMYPAYYEPGTPEYDEAIQADSGLEGVTGDTPCFVVEINGINRYFMVECNSEKIVEATPYQSVDIKTNVTVSTDSASVPFDTEVKIEKLTSGDEYDRIIKALGVKENATYEITLYSEAAGEYITKIDDGKFEVKLPIPKELEGKELAVYYVDGDNKITKHDVNIKDDFAIFYTNHFSSYVLSQIRADDKDENPSGSDNSVEMPADTDNGKSPLTGDNSIVAFIIAAAFVMGVVSVKKIKA